MRPTTPPPSVSISLAELAERIGAAVEGDGSVRVTHVAPLDGAGPGALAFLSDPKYRGALAGTRASAVILSPQMAAHSALPRIVAASPYAAYAKAATILHPAEAVVAGIHASAVIDPLARVASSAQIGPNAVIAARAAIGERARIGAGAVVGVDVEVGDDALIHANVTIYDRCRVGARTILHSGAVIGADGFGMAEDEGRWIKIPQIGRVVIGADVEIGANTTIDRGAIGDTVIEDDVKLDNQIQIGHNCRIGSHTAIAGCVGMAGSVTIGRNCRIGGAVVFSGHLEVCDGVTILAGSGLMNSVTVPGVYGGVPILPRKQWLRTLAAERHLPDIEMRVRKLERAVATGRTGEPPESKEGSS